MRGVLQVLTGPSLEPPPSVCVCVCVYLVGVRQDHRLMDSKFKLPPNPWKSRAKGARYNPFNSPIQLATESP